MSPIVSSLSCSGAERIGLKLLVIIFFLVIAHQILPATSPRDVAQIATNFVNLFSRHGLSVNAATELLHANEQVQRHGAYWQIGSSSRLEEIVLRAESVDESSDDAELRLTLESGLTLKSLEKSFGRWELVYASKTSAVSFRIGARSDQSALIFVRLFTSKPAPDSPVLSVKLRRVTGRQGTGSNDVRHIFVRPAIQLMARGSVDLFAGTENR
jgi:hypothetical protein